VFTSCWRQRDRFFESSRLDLFIGQAPGSAKPSPRSITFRQQQTSADENFYGKASLAINSPLKFHKLKSLGKQRIFRSPFPCAYRFLFDSPEVCDIHETKNSSCYSLYIPPSFQICLNSFWLKLQDWLPWLQLDSLENSQDLRWEKTPAKAIQLSFQVPPKDSLLVIMDFHKSTGPQKALPISLHSRSSKNFTLFWYHRTPL